jgi:hypothetical protein
MGSRQRNLKKQSKASELMNVKLNSILQEIRVIVNELGLPSDHTSIAHSIRILADTVLETGGQPAAARSTGPKTPAHQIASLGSVMTPPSPDSGTSLVDGIDFDIDDEIDIPSEELDDPSLWELDDVEMIATPQSGPQGTTQVQAGAAPAQGTPSVPAFDPESAMAKLQAKLAHAQEHGIKRGGPGMGGSSGFPVQGSADRTPIEDQRAIMEKLTGRPQEKPPGGIMKP